MATIIRMEKQKGLMNAAVEGRIEDVEIYLNDDDVNVDWMNEDSWTALRYACFHGNHDMARFCWIMGPIQMTVTGLAKVHFIWQ